MFSFISDNSSCLLAAFSAKCWDQKTTCFGLKISHPLYSQYLKNLFTGNSLLQTIQHIVFGSVIMQPRFPANCNIKNSIKFIYNSEFSPISNFALWLNFLVVLNIVEAI